ncbi:MBL fold metallo-hydrolase [Dyadobacter sp. CY323]|uniref:MBL fold metallo-hydrolase n=1 Tax=Dyadobacter sp. CY323 TaxID=2907302 RepID=UPI001F36C0DD|nr:MBL fold metallo-hydrolase [Dyadobacter sp. CY323]MCE6993163.1 MBL fold metallo-hydrolase [Dyadobacter sp. CY323]
MKQISDHVYQISIGPVNAFIIEDNGLTLIDTGFKDSKGKIFSAIEKSGKNPGDIKQIILTHSHPDHSGSAADIKNTLRIPVHMHFEDAALVEMGKGGRLPHQRSSSLLNRILYMIFINNSPNETETFQVSTNLKDGDVLPIAGGVEVIHTPGHSEGHIALLVKNDGVLIAGDICNNLLGLDYSTVYEDRAIGAKSILKAATFDFDSAVFGHGSPLTKSANKKILKKFS